MNIAEKEELKKSEDKLKQLKKDQEKKPKKKRGAGFYILMVLILIIVAGGTYVAIDYDNVKQHIPFLADEEKPSEDSDNLDEMKKMMGKGDEDTDNANDETDDEPSDEEPIDEEPVDEEPVDEEPIDEEPEPEKPVVIPSSGGSFHIIAGAFGDPNNATRLVEKLKGMGYDASTIDRGTSTLVSVQSYSTRAEAQNALKDVADAAPKGWVLEWR